MKRRGEDAGFEWPERLRVFRPELWPPVRGEVDEGCMRECCRGDWPDGGWRPRPDLEHDDYAYLDMDPALAAIWREDDAYDRFRKARLEFLGEDHPMYREQVLALIVEGVRRQTAMFAAHRDREGML